MLAASCSVAGVPHSILDRLAIALQARTITADSGVLGLYRGFWPTLLRDVPEIAIQFTLYERLRKVVGAHRGEERLRTWQHLELGGLSGAVAASVTMPLDYVKTATQCGSPMRVRELLEMTLKEKGPRGFFRGWVSACHWEPMCTCSVPCNVAHSSSVNAATKGEQMLIRVLCCQRIILL